MKKTLFVLLCLAFMLFQGCESTEKPPTESPAVAQKGEIAAFYFHMSRRCITCQTLEKIAAETCAQSNITLKSINLEDDSSKKLASSLGVTGQTLLLLKDDKKIDLTQTGFLHARNNPEKFIADIEKAISDIRG